MLPSIRKFWNMLDTLDTSCLSPRPKSLQLRMTDRATRSGLFLCELAMLFHFGIGKIMSDVEDVALLPLCRVRHWSSIKPRQGTSWQCPGSQAWHVDGVVADVQGKIADGESSGSKATRRSPIVNWRLCREASMLLLKCFNTTLSGQHRAATVNRWYE